MSEVFSNSAASNCGRSVTKELWLGTSYFKVSLNDLPLFSSLRESWQPKYIDVCFKFQFQRISGLQFRITCTRLQVRKTIPNGDYKIQFYCDIFDEDTKMFEMQSGEVVAGVDFSLKESRQDLPLRDFSREHDVKILVKMIEYDIVLTKNHILQRGIFREENKEIFSNESVLRDLRYILKVRRLEDIYTGRQNMEYIVERNGFIQRASKYAERLATHMQSKNVSTSPPSAVSESILKYILQGTKGRLSDSDLVDLYKEAHYLGLDFLIQLSQDCFLHRLTEYKKNSLGKCEACMFHVINAASDVNDEKFLDEVLTRLNMTKSLFDYQPLWRRLENSNTSSKFAINFVYRRLEKINSDKNSGNGEASSSKDI